MIECPRHGRLLYGTKCTDCDCRLARFHDGGVIPKGTVHMGFDLASGPDKTATIRMQKVSDRYEFSMEDIERASASITREAEAHLRRETERRRRAMDEEILRAMYGRQAWGPPPNRNAVEIITDPADRRGLDAKRVGP